MPEPVTAKLSFEIEIDVIGTFCRGYPETGPTYSSGGEPGQPDMMEDMEIVGVGYLKPTYTMLPGVPRHVTHPITTGVDMRNPEVQKLLANLLNLVSDQAEEALLGEISE